MYSWGKPNAKGALTHDGMEKSWKRRSKKETAIQALQMLSMIDASPLMPRQVAVLVAGSFLACSWRFMSQQLQEFEHRGMQSLMEVWMVVAASIGLGQIARIVARNHPVDDLVRNCTAAGQVAAASSSSPVQYLPEKEGLELGKVVEEEDQDDVGVQKRIAQAEAAAKLAKYQTDLRQLLASMGKTDNVVDDTLTLYKLADQLFSSPVNLCELVNQGGVPVVMSAAKSALKLLTQQPPQADVLPALMQISWVLVQVAHGPPACCAALVQEDQVTHTLLDLANAVMAVQAPVEAKESILRNLAWVLLVLCDDGACSNRNSSSSSSKPAASLSAMAIEAGAVQVMQSLASLEFGLQPGWVAAATLGLFIQQGQEQQQHLQHQGDSQVQQQQQQLQLMTEAAVQALLQPDSLRGLGYLLSRQPQLSDRLKGLVYGQLHYMLSFHMQELLQLLIEEHLVGSFAAGASPKLGRLLVCQLLSNKGQEVMAHIEQAYECDVPLALAQVIPLPVHLKLPPAPVQQQSATQQQQQQQLHGIHTEIEPEGEIQPVDDAALQQQPPWQQQPHRQQPAVVDDVYTDILACRLLLQHNRLGELLTAFTEELLTLEDVGTSSSAAPATVAAAAAAADDDDDDDAIDDDAISTAGSVSSDHGHTTAAAEASHPELALLSPVCDAVCQLIKYLMSRDLQLQAVQHTRGDSVDDSLSSVSSSTNSSAIDIALSMPSATGAYSTVLAGLVPEGLLPASAAAAAATTSRAKVETLGSSLLTLPAPPPGAPEPCSCGSARGSSRKCDKVVFQFGELRHAVDRPMYKQIKQSSKLVGSVLGREKLVPGQPVTLFTTPHFTHEANLWVLQCLERWLATGALEGFNTQQAAKLWVAADFLQVDALQVACEDVIIAAAVQDDSLLDVALELCSHHRSSSSRLQRLVVQIVLKGLDSAGGLGRLKRLLQQHGAVMSPSLHADVRDQLVTLCMLNAGLDDDMADGLVE